MISLQKIIYQLEAMEIYVDKYFLKYQDFGGVWTSSEIEKVLNQNY